jgi:hypothetical protein
VTKYVDLDSLSAADLRHIAAAKEGRPQIEDPDDRAQAIADDLAILSEKYPDGFLGFPGLQFVRKWRLPRKLKPAPRCDPSVYLRVADQLFDLEFTDEVAVQAVVTTMIDDGHDAELAHTVAAQALANHRAG